MIREGIRILESALVVALPIGLVVGAVRAGLQDTLGANRLYFYLARAATLQALLGVAVFLVLYLALSALLARWLAGPRLRSLAATAGAPAIGA